MEHPRNHEAQVGSQHGIDHEIAQGLAEHDAEQSVVVARDRNQVFVAVVLAGRSG